MNKTIPTMNDIIRSAQEISLVTVGEIIGSTRMAYVMRVRQACYYVSRQQGYPSPQIASRFGRRDHTTILHGCRVCADWMKRDPHYAAFVDELEARAKARRARENNIYKEAFGKLGEPIETWTV